MLFTYICQPLYTHVYTSTYTSAHISVTAFLLENIVEQYGARTLYHKFPPL